MSKKLSTFPFFLHLCYLPIYQNTMTTATFSVFRGPSDDWDPQGYDDTEGENLTALGMHSTDDKDVDLEEDEDATAKKAEAVIVPIEDEEEEVDGLKALEKLERELKVESLSLGGVDEE